MVIRLRLNSLLVALLVRLIAREVRWDARVRVIVHFGISIEILVTHGAWLEDSFLLILLFLFLPTMLIFQQFALLNNLVHKKLAENLLGTDVERLLTIVTLHRNEFNAVILRHDILLNEFIF